MISTCSSIAAKYYKWISNLEGNISISIIPFSIIVFRTLYKIEINSIRSKCYQSNSGLLFRKRFQQIPNQSNLAGFRFLSAIFFFQIEFLRKISINQSGPNLTYMNKLYKKYDFTFETEKFNKIREQANVYRIIILFIFRLIFSLSLWKCVTICFTSSFGLFHMRWLPFRVYVSFNVHLMWFNLECAVPRNGKHVINFDVNRRK